MAQQLINRGTVQDDPNADTLFVAFGKVNANDSDLYGKFAALATVALSGAYSDLTGKPTLGTLAGLNSVTLTANVTGILPLANGGTNNNATPVTGTVSWFDGTKFTSDANLTWSATTGLLTQKGISSKGAANGIGTELFGLGAFDNCTLTTTSNTIIGAGAGQVGNNGFEIQNVIIGQGSTISSASQSTLLGQGISVSPSFTQNHTIVGQGISVTAGNANTIVGANQTTNRTTAMFGRDNVVNATASNIGIFGPANSYSNGRGALFGAGLSSYRDNELGIGFASDNAGDPFHLSFTGSTSPFLGRQLLRIGSAWIDATDATRKARALFYVNDTAEREYMRADANGTGADVFFNGNSVSIAGAVSFGVFTASALAPVTGYISITDNTGNVRHLACV